MQKKTAVDIVQLYRPTIFQSATET